MIKITLIDIAINGIFQGIGTGVGVIVAEIWIRDKLIHNKEKFDKTMKDVKRNLTFPKMEGD